MAKWALYHGQSVPTMDTNDVLTLNLDIRFINTDGDTVVTEDGSVPVILDPSSTEVLMHQAIVTAIVNYANTAFGWTVPREAVTHPTISKGLVI